MMIRADGVVAAAFAGWAFGIAWAFARVVLRYPPWKGLKQQIMGR